MDEEKADIVLELGGAGAERSNGRGKEVRSPQQVAGVQGPFIHSVGPDVDLTGALDGALVIGVQNPIRELPHQIQGGSAESPNLGRIEEALGLLHQAREILLFQDRLDGRPAPGLDGLLNAVEEPVEIVPRSYPASRRRR